MLKYIYHTNRRVYTMEEKYLKNVDANATVPVYVLEAQMIQQKRITSQWMTVCLALIVAIVLVVAGAMYERLQYDSASMETVTVDGKTGVANYIGNDGDIYNGEDSSAQGEGSEVEEPQER
jgi:uncharacterized membrane protein YjdF